MPPKGILFIFNSMKDNLTENISTPIFTTEAMRALDQETKKQAEGDDIENGYALMKLAGKALFDFVVQKLGNAPRKNVAVFIGGGNNGGDGLVLSTLLMEAGIPCTVFSLAEEDHFHNEAKMALDDFKANRGSLILTNGILAPNKSFTLVVDCMLGIGARGDLRTEYAKAVQSINAWGLPVIAADVPTGYDSTNHHRGYPCLSAQDTLLFGMPRLDAYVREGGEVFGNVHIAPLTYPDYLIQKNASGIYLADESLIPQLLPKRNDWSEKRENGCALIIAGSVNMTGAAAMCTEAALRSGAGLVTLASPKSIIPILQAKMTEPVFCGLPDDGNGFLCPGNIPSLLQKTEHSQAIAIGPGLSTEPSVKETVIEYLSKVESTPIVVDADALNAIASEVSILQAITAPTILTPHKREYERLFGALPATAEGICEHLRKNAESTNKIILLKGSPTWIAIPNGHIYVVPTANSGMAKGGSGDVLTGIIVSLLSQGVTPENSTILGALLHQKAGKITREKLGPFAMLPSDIIGNLYEAFS